MIASGPSSCHACSPGMEASEHALSHAEELLEEAARVRAEVP